MKFKPDTLASVHEQTALVKAQSTGGVSMDYFRQEMVGLQILTAAIIKDELPRNSTTGMARPVRGRAFGGAMPPRIAFSETVKSPPLSLPLGIAGLVAFYLAYQQFCRVNKIL